jgi:outer membrane autotransporter protein
LDISTQGIDASVKGVISAQTTATARFAGAQIRNISDHLIHLSSGQYGNGNNFSFSLISPSFTPLNPPQSGQLYAAESNQIRSFSTMHSDSQMPQRPSDFLFAIDAPLATVKPMVIGSVDPEQVPLAGPAYSFWATGQVFHGSVDVLASTNKFHTDGVSMGVDFQLNPKVIVGAAVGYGNDSTDVDQLGTRVRGQQVAVTVYGVYEPVKGWRIDGLLGYGDLSFDNDRYSALSHTIFSAQRKGSSSYAELGLNLPMVVNNFNVNPYVRVNYLETTLDAYNEGANSNALAFDRSKLVSSALYVGVMAFYDFAQADGAKWTPNAMLELRRNAGGSANQVISFVGTPVNTSALDVSNAPSDVQTMGLGISYTHKRGARFGLRWLESRGTDSYRSTGYQLNASMPF